MRQVLRLNILSAFICRSINNTVKNLKIYNYRSTKIFVKTKQKLFVSAVWFVKFSLFMLIKKNTLWMDNFTILKLYNANFKKKIPSETFNFLMLLFIISKKKANLKENNNLFFLTSYCYIHT